MKNSNATAAIVGTAVVALAVGFLVGTSTWPEEPEPPVVPEPESPCEDVSGDTYKVMISINDENEPPTLVVEPDPLPSQEGTIQQCDFVVFINETGQEVNLSFESPIGSPFYGESGATIGAEGMVTRQVGVNPEEVTEYTYTVTVGDLERSPKIRVRPRDETN